MALTSGETFAGYTVVRRLDSGATDDVYLLEDPQTSRPVALKFLSPALSNDGAFRARFLSETAASAGLEHPHIVESYARGEYDGRLWVVTDYVEGTTAAQQMNDRFPAVAAAHDVLPMVSAVAGALDYAHEHGMLHRDVKPANIVLSNPTQGESRILLTDFGIGSPTGTGGYAAPEIRSAGDGAEVDGRADQYALAATAFHMLTGTPPGAGPSRLSEQRPELAGLEGAFAKALSRDPADRFDSCSQFADAVNAAASTSIGERTAAPAPEAVSVVSYPAYASHDEAAHEDAAIASAPEPAPARLVYAGPATAVATKRRSRVLWAALATLALLAGVLGLGALIGRQKTDNTAASIRALTPPASAPGSPPASGPAGVPTTSPGQPPAAPNRLDGTYRLNVQRSKQTFNYTPAPEPPDVDTWWAFRTTCTQSFCSAIAVQLDDNDHSLAKTPSGRPIILKFNDGEWRSQRETVQFPCVRDDGAKRTQTQTQVLTLRPEPNGNLVGEMEVRVHSNECGEKAATIRVPSTANRTGDTPPGVYVPDPARAGAGPGEVPEENTPTTTPTTASPTTTPSR